MNQKESAAGSAPSLNEVQAHCIELLRQGKYDVAAKLMEQLVARGAVDVATLNNLGIAYRNLGRCDDAVIAYKKAIDMNPNYRNAHVNLGVVLLMKSEFANALAAFDRAILLRTANDNSDFSAELTGRATALSRLVSDWHIPMMNDESRNSAYQMAIDVTVGSNTNVLEIGTGSGLLAMMAARSGAASVTSCEAIPLIANTAKSIVSKNGYGSKVTIINKLSTELEVGIDLPGHADLLVSEVFSSELLGEGVLSSIEDAKRRLLRKDGVVLPGVASIMIALVGGDWAENNLGVTSVCGFDVSDFNACASPKRLLNGYNDTISLISKPAEAFRFDFNANDYFPAAQAIYSLEVTETAQCWGIIQWIRLEMVNDLCFENHPLKKVNASGWQQVLYRFDQPVSVQRGEVFEVVGAHNRVATWFKRAGS